MDSVEKIIIGALTSVMGGFLIWAVKTVYQLRKGKAEAEKEKIKAEEDLKETVQGLNENMQDVQAKLDELLEISKHNGLSNKHLLSYRIERLCLDALTRCSQTGVKEIDKDLLARINNMHAEYKYFGGNSVIDKLVERVNDLHIVD